MAAVDGEAGLVGAGATALAAGGALGVAAVEVAGAAQAAALNTQHPAIASDRITPDPILREHYADPSRLPSPTGLASPSWTP